MSPLDTIRDILLKFAKSIAEQSRAKEFSCGICNRRDRCGFPPHPDCAVMAAQLDGEKPLRRATLI